MKSKNIMVWGFFAAGVLAAVAGLRDIFAPGVFSISPRIPGSGEIIGQLVMAAAFFVVAVVSKTKTWTTS